jgi:AcrR family transcriptional regulator
MSPRPDVSDERKNQILDAATKVFARLGFHKANMDDISKAADMSKGLLYWYFKSKDAIITAILDRFFAIELNDFEVFRDKSLKPSERLMGYVENLLKRMDSFSVLIPLAFDFYALAARQEAVRTFFKNYFTIYRQALAALIQEGIEEGEFREVNPEEAAITFTAVLEGILLLAAVDSKAVKYHSQSLAAVKLFLEGLKVHS